MAKGDVPRRGYGSAFARRVYVGRPSSKNRSITCNLTNTQSLLLVEAFLRSQGLAGLWSPLRKLVLFLVRRATGGESRVDMVVWWRGRNEPDDQTRISVSAK